MKRRRGAFAIANQRDVNADEIGIAQRVLKRYVLDPGLGFLNAAGVAQVHRLLNRADEFVIPICRVVAQNVHVEPRALLDHRQANAPGANNGHGLSSNLVAEEGKVRVPESPVIFAGQMFSRPQPPRQTSQDEKRKLRGGFSKNVGGVRERNLETVGVSAIDVVKSYGVLRNYLQSALAGLEYFRINLIAQGCDQSVNSRA